MRNTTDGTHDGFRLAWSRSVIGDFLDRSPEKIETGDSTLALIRQVQDQPNNVGPDLIAASEIAAGGEALNAVPFELAREKLVLEKFQEFVDAATEVRGGRLFGFDQNVLQQFTAVRCLPVQARAQNLLAISREVNQLPQLSENDVVILGSMIRVAAAAPASRIETRQKEISKLREMCVNPEQAAASIKRLRKRVPAAVLQTGCFILQLTAGWSPFVGGKPGKSREKPIRFNFKYPPASSYYREHLGDDAHIASPDNVKIGWFPVVIVLSVVVGLVLPFFTQHRPSTRKRPKSTFNRPDASASEAIRNGRKFKVPTSPAPSLQPGAGIPRPDPTHSYDDYLQRSKERRERTEKQFRQMLDQFENHKNKPKLRIPLPDIYDD